MSAFPKAPGRLRAAAPSEKAAPFCAFRHIPPLLGSDALLIRTFPSSIQTFYEVFRSVFSGSSDAFSGEVTARQDECDAFFTSLPKMGRDSEEV
jgi:hypothetical protein